MDTPESSNIKIVISMTRVKSILHAIIFQVIDYRKKNTAFYITIFYSVVSVVSVVLEKNERKPRKYYETLFFKFFK